MRVRGVRPTRQDPSRGVMIWDSTAGSDEFDWLTVYQAKRFLERLRKAIAVAEDKEPKP